MFKNKYLNECYERYGFVVIRKFFSEEQLKTIGQKYYELFPQRPVNMPGMWATQQYQNGQSQLELAELLLGHFGNRANEIFNARFRTGVVMDKFPGLLSECKPHRDWSVTDEKRFESAVIWSSLKDITMKNGPVYFLPGSHKASTFLQVPFAEWPYQKFEAIIKKYSQIVLVNKGDLVVYSSRVVHGSLPNLSGEDRPVITMGITDFDAQLVYYYKDAEMGDEPVEGYNVESEFFHTHRFGTRPDNRTPDFIVEQEVKAYDQASFEEMCMSLPTLSADYDTAYPFQEMST
jgi:ectoine hydroxylase-related dioxygenase (phytanoyl-CoA dioxygenase family)